MCLKFQRSQQEFQKTCREEKTERKDYYREERSFGSFSRKLRLPLEVQIDKSTAAFKDGVLEIRLPKSDAEKQKVRKIKVQ